MLPDPFHLPMHMPGSRAFRARGEPYPVRKKDEGSKQRPNEIAYPAGYRISRVEENYYLRTSRWLRTYLPSYWLSEGSRTFLIPGKLLFIRRYILFNPKNSTRLRHKRMPGITASRYVRGIPNPHSAYASAEIPENVTIFKNLSRCLTTPPPSPLRRRQYIRFARSRRSHQPPSGANDTRRNSPRTVAVRQRPTQQHVSHSAVVGGFNEEPARFAAGSLAQIHADPYTHKCCECAVT